jgi:hypothetical protein
MCKEHIVNKKILWLLALTTLGLNGAFVGSGDIVTDEKTALVWQDTPTDPMAWEDALLYCEELSLEGKDDWRLPNKKELESLINYGASNPSIDSSFTHVLPSLYWSSTTKANYSDHAWVASFFWGYVQGELKTQPYCVRCVRGGSKEYSAYTLD